tara:strand:+ start:1529 stop:1720 length:192 start_codon:yes stop_codon:yes gene_type:complete
MSKVDEAKKHLDAALIELMQAVSLLGQESSGNDAYRMHWERLFGYAKGLRQINESLNEDEEQA